MPGVHRDSEEIIEVRGVKDENYAANFSDTIYVSINGSITTILEVNVVKKTTSAGWYDERGFMYWSTHYLSYHWP